MTKEQQINYIEEGRKYTPGLDSNERKLAEKWHKATVQQMELIVRTGAYESSRNKNTKQL